MSNGHITQFSQTQVPIFTPLGAGIRGVVELKRARDAAAAQEGLYREALEAYSKDATKENLMAVYEANPAKFEQTKKMWDAMDEVERKNQLNQP